MAYEPTIDEMVAKYNALYMKSVAPAAPAAERDTATKIMTKLRAKYPGIEIDAARARAKAAVSPAPAGMPDVPPMPDGLFKDALRWAFQLFDDEGIDDPFTRMLREMLSASVPELKESRMHEKKPEVEKQEGAKQSKEEKRANRIADAKKLAKRLSKALDDKALGEPYLDLDAKTITLDIEIPLKLWEDLHDDPATLIEWIDENAAEAPPDDDDDDEDEDEDDDTGDTGDDEDEDE